MQPAMYCSASDGLMKPAKMKQKKAIQGLRGLEFGRGSRINVPIAESPEMVLNFTVIVPSEKLSTPFSRGTG